MRYGPNGLPYHYVKRSDVTGNLFEWLLGENNAKSKLPARMVWEAAYPLKKDFCRVFCIVMIYVKQITTQAEQDGEMNQMTLPYRHRVRNLSPGDLKRIIYVSVTEPELPPPPTLHRFVPQGMENIIYYIIFCFL